MVRDVKMETEVVKEQDLSEASLPSKFIKSGAHDPNLWTIHGQTYDLKAFVAHHPGGKHAIGLGQGRDCTVLFESYHPFTEKHKKTLGRFKSVPNVHDDTYVWNQTPFYDEARDAVRKYFSPKGTETPTEIHQNMKATWAAWFEHAVKFAITLYCFYRWCLQESLLSIIYFPTMYWICCSDLMHNGSHFAMSTHPWINTVSAYIGSLHVQFHLWSTQHVIGHHIYTNMIDGDPDLHHFTHEKEPGIPGYRTHRAQKYLAKYKLWKFAVFFQVLTTTMALAALNVPLYLAEKAFFVTKIPDRWITPIKIDRAIMLTGVAAFLYCHGLGSGLYTLFWTWAVHGTLFNFFSQISHVNEDCMDAVDAFKAEKNQDKTEWAVHEMLTAVDYDVNSYFWRTLSINLNQQMLHHLFPSVHPCHYVALRDVIIPVAAKHGVDYKARSSHTFLDLARKYLTWITGLNEINAEGVKSIPTGSEEVVSSSNAWSLIICVVSVTVTLVLPTYYALQD